MLFFFEQDRITTTSTSISSTKPITIIGTIVVVVVADGVFVGTVIAVMAVVADGDFVGTVVVVMAAMADGDVLVEHIDPDEPTNMSVSSAFEWIQAYPQSVWLKDVAPKNIFNIEVTRDTSQLDRSVLKDVA